MKKIAVFVEGMTEQELVIALITELVGLHGLHIERAEQFRGTVTLRPVSPPVGTSFFVLVVDCRSDEQVKTQIRDQYSSLTNAGYTSIIGLRDVYPNSAADVPRLTALLMSGLPSSPIVPSMHLAVMEVEAWFIAEVSHFSRIHTALDSASMAAAGFDCNATPADSWHHPATALDDIYKIAGKRYLTNSGQKTRNRVQRTIRALCFTTIYQETRHQVAALDAFIQSVEQALF